MIQKYYFMQEKIKISSLIVLIFIFYADLHAQDTLRTNYPNTNQRWEKIYDQGKKTAENIYHQNNLPWMTVQYTSDQVEEWKWYHENGNPYFQATIINDLLQGHYQIWYENGQLAESLFFVDNLENGIAHFYHLNGQLSMQGSYKMGKMVDDWQFFDEFGEPATGLWKWMFAASRASIRMEGLLRNGQPIGDWKYRTTADMGAPDQKVFTHALESTNR